MKRKDLQRVFMKEDSPTLLKIKKPNFRNEKIQKFQKSEKLNMK